jgi:tRNA A37 threonylcarbamoyladenosine dehydratase
MVMSTEDPRFAGVARLYGIEGLERLRAAHVAIVGVGGVGSWAAEAMARCGVGEISLFDLDDVCVSNANRQLHALDSTVGKPKVEVMAERLRGSTRTAPCTRWRISSPARPWPSTSRRTSTA